MKIYLDAREEGMLCWVLFQKLRSLGLQIQGKLGDKWTRLSDNMAYIDYRGNKHSNLEHLSIQGCTTRALL